MRGLGRVQEIIKNLEKLEGDIESINVTMERCALKAVVKFSRHEMSDWKIPRISEEGVNLFCSFATEKDIYFKRQ